MGIPHAGAGLATMGHHLARYLELFGKANAELFEPLKTNSPTLAETQQRFQKLLLHHTEIEVYCFFEEQGMPGIGIIVPENSAVLAQYGNQGITADHRNMTKFTSKRDNGYLKALGRVLDCLEVIEEQMKSVARDDASSIFSKFIPCLRLSNYEENKDRNINPVPGTCGWCLEQQKYKDWRDSKESSLLWVSANPGCGKSVLAKFLVDTALPSSKSRIICYFFFKENDVNAKTATAALCGMLQQLLSQHSKISHHLDEAYKHEGNRLFDNFHALWALLLKVTSQPNNPEIICVMDAIGECEVTEAIRLLGSICQFYNDQNHSPKRPPLKFLITGRPLQHIRNSFCEVSRNNMVTELAGEGRTNQIQVEVDKVIRVCLSELEETFNPDARVMDNLRQELTRFKHPTYLWVTLVFKLLENPDNLTRQGRENIFNQIPETVDGAYTTILEKISGKNQDKVWKLLNIVCAARSPLSTQEIYLAMSINESCKSYEELDFAEKELCATWFSSLCGLFVNVVEDRVYLLHQTAQCAKK